MVTCGREDRLQEDRGQCTIGATIPDRLRDVGERVEALLGRKGRHDGDQLKRVGVGVRVRDMVRLRVRVRVTVRVRVGVRVRIRAWVLIRERVVA